jgi:hypothetical protein
LIPFEALAAFEMTTLGDERVAGLEVDEALLAERLRGDGVLLRELEIVMLQWVGLTILYEEQRELALRLLNLLQVNGAH